MVWVLNLRDFYRWAACVLSFLQNMSQIEQCLSEKQTPNSVWVSCYIILVLKAWMYHFQECFIFSKIRAFAIYRLSLKESSILYTGYLVNTNAYFLNRQLCTHILHCNFWAILLLKPKLNTITCLKNSIRIQSHVLQRITLSSFTSKNFKYFKIYLLNSLSPDIYLWKRDMGE